MPKEGRPFSPTPNSKIRIFLRGGELWRAFIAIPAAWAAFEHLNSFISQQSTFGNTG